MKRFFNKYQPQLIAFLAIVMVAFGMSAFDYLSPKKSVYIETDANGLEVINEMVGGVPQQKTYALDTLTTAGTYTTILPFNMASAYQYQYFFKLRKIGVTPNIKVVLDEKNAATSSIWSPIDSFSMSGADSTKLNFRFRGSITYGSRHRIRYVKTGNGAVARNVEIVIKPTVQ